MIIIFDPQSYVESILMDNDIISLTGDKTIHYIHAKSPIAPYIEYEFYDEDGALYEEGVEINTNFYLQIDIFSKDSFKSLENIIKEKMKNASFVKGKAADQFEADTQLYHKAMRFSFSN